jgi:3-oxoacyl-[acyl-carrier-protein] synthase III
MPPIGSLILASDLMTLPEGASLPTALEVAIRDGRIQRGHRVLLLGTGAGLSIGGITLEY